MVAEDLAELKDPQARPDVLQAISQHSGGQVLQIDDSWVSIDRKPPAVTQVNRRALLYGLLGGPYY